MAEASPVALSPHDASILASITRRKLAHRAHGRWGGSASSDATAAAFSSSSSAAVPASASDRERVWSRHGMAQRFPAFVAQSFEQLGHAAPTLEEYEDAHTFLERHTAAAAAAQAAAAGDATAPSSAPPLLAVPRIRASSCSPALFKSRFDAEGIPVIFDRGLMQTQQEDESNGGEQPQSQQQPQSPREWNMASWTIDGISEASFKYAAVKFKVDEQQSSDAASAEDVADDQASAEDDASAADDDDAAASDEQSGSFKLPLHDFMLYARHNRDDVPLYIFDAVFDCDPVGRELLADFTPAPHFTPDLFAALGEVRRPPYRWLLVGPTRSGSALHQDPLSTSAWNTCIDGVKRWVLFPPHISRDEIKGARVIDQSIFPLPPGEESAAAAAASSPSQSPAAMSADDLDDASEGVYYFTHSLPVLRRDWAARHRGTPLADSAPHSMLDLLQHPGETIFIPSGWWHAVINLGPTLAVTQNFVSAANFARSWQLARKQRPHMARRWAEQIRSESKTSEHEHGAHSQMAAVAAHITAADLAELARVTERPRAPGQPPRSPRRPAGSSADPAVSEDPESWMWNNSSSEEDDDDEEAEGDKQDQSYK